MAQKKLVRDRFLFNDGRDQNSEFLSEFSTDIDWIERRSGNSLRHSENHCHGITASPFV
jgi:hypothetical protein